MPGDILGLELWGLEVSVPRGILGLELWGLEVSVPGAMGLEVSCAWGYSRTRAMGARGICT